MGYISVINGKTDNDKIMEELRGILYFYCSMLSIDIVLICLITGEIFNYKIDTNELNHEQLQDTNIFLADQGDMVECVNSIILKKYNINFDISCFSIGDIGQIFLGNLKKRVFNEGEKSLIFLLIENIIKRIEIKTFKEHDLRDYNEFAVLLFDKILSTSSDEYENNLSKILNKISKIVKAEGAGIVLYDMETRKFILQKPAFGISDDNLINYYNTPLGSGSNAEIVFTTGKPYISNDASTDPRLKKYINIFPARNLISIPLKIGQTTIGVLNVINKIDDNFNETDVKILNVIGYQVSNFIEKNKIYNNIRITDLISVQQKLMKTIDDRTFQLNKYKNMYIELTESMLDSNNNINTITNKLSEIIDSNILVINKDYVELAYAYRENLEFNKNIILESAKSKILMSNFSSNNIEYISEQNFNIIIASIIVYEKDLVGYMVVINNTNLNPLEIDAIKFGALIFGIEIIKNKLATEIEEKYKNNFITNLLTGNFTSENEMLINSTYLGYDLAIKNNYVFTIKFTDAKNRTKNYNINDILLFLKNYIKEICKSSFVIVKENIFVMIVCCDNPKQVANKICKIANDKISHSTNIGIGSKANFLKEIAKSFKEAKQALKIANKCNNMGNIVLFDDIRFYHLLDQINCRDIFNFIDKLLGPLIEYDKNKGTSFLQTLDIYLENECNIQKTCKRMYLHTNTLNYRLKRINEILDMNVKESNHRLQLQIAFKLFDMYNLN